MFKKPFSNTNDHNQLIRITHNKFSYWFNMCKKSFRLLIVLKITHNNYYFNYGDTKDVTGDTKDKKISNTNDHNLLIRITHNNFSYWFNMCKKSFPIY